MTTLIKRLEALTGPSREVDAEIAKATGWKPVQWEFAGKYGVAWGAVPPNFTSSLDAARSIFPNAMLIYANEIGADGLPYVQLCTNTSTNPVTVHAGIGATLEIAWCIAALKARDSSNEN